MLSLKSNGIDPLMEIIAMKTKALYLPYVSVGEALRKRNNDDPSVRWWISSRFMESPDYQAYQVALHYSWLAMWRKIAFEAASKRGA